MNLKETFEKQGGIKLLKQYYCGGALFTAIGEFLLLGKSKTSLEILRNAASLKIKQKLEKKYLDKIEKIEKKYKEGSIATDRKVWICWFQVMENAPEVVKRCYASIKDNITDREVILLTENNYREYICFPQEIQAKIDSGIIKGGNEVECKKTEKPMPALPVGTAFWTPKPDLSTAAEAWILAGGAHHTAFTYDLTAEQMGDWAAAMGIEAVYIDGDTTIRNLQNELRWNSMYFSK